jgi:anti-anti-sigma factor
VWGQASSDSGRYSSPRYAAFVAPEVGNAMATAGSFFFTPSDRPPLSPEAFEGRPVVVRPWGEHDVSTDGALCLTLARAIALDSAGLVLDLSEVEVIGPSTFGVIVRAREFLRQRSASLTVRSPSEPAQSTMDDCGLSDLLCPNPGTAARSGGQHCSWVEGPTRP